MNTTLPDVIQCDFTATNDGELKSGVQNLGPGQTLCILPGTYNMKFFQFADPNDPNAVAIPSGEPRNPVTITGYDPNTGTIPDAANRPRIQPHISFPDQVAYLQDAHDIVIDSLFLDGSSGQVDPTGIPQKTANDIVKLTGTGNPPCTPISGCTNIIITNCELAWAVNNGVLMTELCLYNQFLNLSVHDNGDPTAPLPHGHGFYINTSYNVVDHCEISHNAGNGIQCYSEQSPVYAAHNIIRDCLIHDNGNSGIIVIASPSNTPPCPSPTAENVANNVIYNNVIYNNSDAGIWIGGTSGTAGVATDAQVYNNSVFHNGETGEVHGIYVDPNSTSIDAQNNISSQNVGGEYSGNVDRSKNWPEGSAPPFVDITNPNAPNLHLSSHTSPQGGHLGIVTSDADGGCRPSGRYDMGAYEFGSTPNQCATWLSNNRRFLTMPSQNVIQVVAGSFCKGLSIAAYFSPRSHPELWDKVAASFPATQMIVYDPSGAQSGVDPVYKSKIDQMKQAGIRVFGYVNTGGGNIDPATVKGNIDNHRAFYNVTDIMFDNARTITAHIPYYKGLTDYVHGQTPGSLVEMNASSSVLGAEEVPEAYMQFDDILAWFEGTYEEYFRPNFPNNRLMSWAKKYPSIRFKNYIHHIPDSSVMPSLLQTLIQNNTAFFHLSDQTNPYEDLGTDAFFNALVPAVEAACACRPLVLTPIL